MKRVTGRIAMVLILLAALLFSGCSQQGATPPSARPVIQNGTVYTAWGTLLRGTVISTEGNAPGEFIIPPDSMTQLTQNGLNALHIYAERYRDGKPVGASAQNCDALIEEAHKNGMVVVLTVGEMRHEPDAFLKDEQFLYEFWDFYADRYKDKENVIFEICNEAPLVKNIAEVQANAYRIIRNHAPDTMVLFYSLSITEDVASFLPYIQQTERLIGGDDLWANAALAFHGYESQEDLQGADHFRAVIHALQRAGYPILNTELPNRFEQSGYPDTALLRVCEEEGISWLSFVSWIRIAEPSYWRGQIEAAGVTWQPDYGNWPLLDMRYPFGWNTAWNTAGSSPADTIPVYRGHAYLLGNGDYIDFRDLNFGTRAPITFTVTAKADGDGTLTVHRDAVDGPVVGICQVTGTDDAFVALSGDMTDMVKGVADLFFVFHTEAGSIFQFKDWKFDLPAQYSYSNPYNTVFAANYPFCSDGITRGANTDAASAAPFQVNGITDQSWLLYDFVGFRGEDVLLHLRMLPISGGQVTVYAGDRQLEYFELEHFDVTGRAGEWQEYTCLLNQSDILMYDPVLQYWDLQFVFTGDAEGELFYISEFWFEPL